MSNIDQLYQSYFRDVYRFLLSLCQDHYTAEDIVQETFLRAYLYVELYRNENVKSWLFKVAYRTYIDHYRKQKKNIIKEIGFFHRLKQQGPSLHEQIILNEEMHELQTWIHDLPEKQRIAIVLHDIHELPYKEAAQIMNVTLNHYKILLFRGRQSIRQRKGEQE